MKKDLLSYSAFREFKKSPNHLLDYWYNKKDPTPSMVEGSLGHCLILEPEKFNEKFVVFDGRRAGGVWNEFRQDVLKEEKPRTIITKKQYDNVSEIVEVAIKDGIFKDLLSRVAVFERHIKWNTLDLDFHGYVDGEGDEFIMDVKFCQDSGDKFMRDLQYGTMAMQGAMYLEHYKHQKSYIIVAIEKKAPFNVQAYQLSIDTIMNARHEFFELCEQYKVWDGRRQSYSGSIITI